LLATLVVDLPTFAQGSESPAQTPLLLTDVQGNYALGHHMDILANPEKGILPDMRAGRTVAKAMKYYSFRIAGSDQGYPLERIPVWQAFAGKSASVDDIEADLVDRCVPLEIWANPVKDEAGNVESVVAAFQDITVRQQVNAELEAYRQQLEQLVAQRTAELSITNEQLQTENAERRRLEDLLNSRLEWLVVVYQVSQRVTTLSALPRAYQTLSKLSP
jgi:hypothetical protein